MSTAAMRKVSVIDAANACLDRSTKEANA